MSPPNRTFRTWTRVSTCPVPGVEPCTDGSFRIGEQRFSPGAGLYGYSVGEASADREPGADRPLVVQSARGRVLLLYRNGLWYQSADGPPQAVPAASPGGKGERLPAKAPGRPGGGAAPLPAAAKAPPVADQVVGLGYVEPGAIEPAPKPQPPRPAAGPRRWAAVALLLLVLTALAVSALPLMLARMDEGLAERAANQCRFDENTWLDTWAYHTFVTHAFLHTGAAELAFFAAGILLFGWIVGRNVGCLRTVLLFCFCAAFSVGFWQFAKTPFGQDLIVRYAGKLFDYVNEKYGWEAGVTAWLAYAQAWEQMLALRGPVWGAGGALAGLITFAVCRRRFRRGRVEVRWLVLVLALAYLAVGGWVWVHALGRDVAELPFVLYLGGALGGLFFVIPDRFLHELLDAAKDKLIDTLSQRRAGAAGQQTD
jgi:hypothetical protein